MNSRNSYPGDELDRLIRGALQAQAGRYAPPDRVWNHIQLVLEADQAPPRSPRRGWSPVVVQAALALMLAMLGGVGLQRLFNLGTSYPGGDVSPSVTVTVDEGLSPPDIIWVAVESDISLLRALAKSGSPAARTRGGSQDHPPLFIPQDVPPHPFSPEGRLLAAKLSTAPYFVSASALAFGGPAEK